MPRLSSAADSDALAASFNDDRIACYDNLGSRVFGNGFDSEAPASSNPSSWWRGVP